MSDASRYRRGSPRRAWERSCRRAALRGLVLLGAAMLAALMLAAPAAAVIVFFKDGRPAVRGQLVRESPEAVVVRVTLADGSAVEQSFLRSEVDDVLMTVSAERLASLSPDRPQEYRNYAEELTEKREDPDARDAALRLYLIAAHLAPRDLGRSALLGMAGLARSEEEQRKFRAMAYLLDAGHDRRLLQQTAPAAAATPVDPADDADRQQVLRAVQALRRGERRLAHNLAQREGMASAFATLGFGLTHGQFLAAASSPFGPDDDLLRQLLQIELALTRGPVAAAPLEEAEGAVRGWAAALARGDFTPAPVLSLETLTEFDPRECVFRDGRWQRP